MFDWDTFNQFPYVPYKPSTPGILPGTSTSTPVTDILTQMMKNYAVEKKGGWTISETAEHNVYSADLPGVKKEDLNIYIEGAYLTVEATRTDTKESYKYSSYMGACAGLDIEAPGYENGVLTVKFKKKAATKPKRHQLTPK